MKKIKKILIVISIILLLAGMVFTIYISFNLYGGEWVCISQKCVAYAEGDDWVKQNCNLLESDMICEFQLEGQNFRAPLSGINVSQMISCKEYKCDSEVLIRTNR